MAESMPHGATPNDTPEILDVTENGDGSYCLGFRDVKARDVFATLRFHEPDEECFQRHVSRIFDVAVERGMFQNTRFVIADPTDSQELQGVTFERTMVFSEEVTPEQARQAFLAAYGQAEEHANAMVIHVLSAFIDAGLMPARGITFDSRNEIVAAQPDTLAAELNALTERHYGGQGLGGPAMGS